MNTRINHVYGLLNKLRELIGNLSKPIIQRWWFIPLLACILGIAFCTGQLIGLFFGVNNEIASFQFGNGYYIRIWGESDGILDPNWDADDVGSEIYYLIAESGNVIIPKTFLGFEVFKNTYTSNIKMVSADKGNLICIYDKVGWGNGIFFIFELAHPEKWNYFTNDSAERQRWLDRYKRLTEENPDLPPALKGWSDS